MDVKPPQNRFPYHLPASSPPQTLRNSSVSVTWYPDEWYPLSCPCRPVSEAQGVVVGSGRIAPEDVAETLVVAEGDVVVGAASGARLGTLVSVGLTGLVGFLGFFFFFTGTAVSASRFVAGCVLGETGGFGTSDALGRDDEYWEALAPKLPLGGGR